MTRLVGPAPDVCPLKPPRFGVGGLGKFLIWRDECGWVVARGLAVATYSRTRTSPITGFTMWDFETIAWGLPSWDSAAAVMAGGRDR